MFPVWQLNRLKWATEFSQCTHSVSLACEVSTVFCRHFSQCETWYRLNTLLRLITTNDCFNTTVDVFITMLVLNIFKIFVVKILKKLSIYLPTEMLLNAKCILPYTNLATKLASVFTSQTRNLLQWLFILPSVNSKVFAKNDNGIKKNKPQLKSQ